MFNKSDITRDACQLFGAQARKGYDWWWYSFTAYGAWGEDAAQLHRFWGWNRIHADNVGCEWGEYC